MHNFNPPQGSNICGISDVSKKIFNISNKSYLAIFVSKIFKRTQETADDDNDEKKVLPICLTGLKDTFLIKDK